jgi:hypothetical protein
LSTSPILNDPEEYPQLSKSRSDQFRCSRIVSKARIFSSSARAFTISARLVSDLAVTRSSMRVPSPTHIGDPALCSIFTGRGTPCCHRQKSSFGGASHRSTRGVTRFGMFQASGVPLQNTTNVAPRCRPAVYQCSMRHRHRDSCDSRARPGREQLEVTLLNLQARLQYSLVVSITGWIPIVDIRIDRAARCATKTVHHAPSLDSMLPTANVKGADICGNDLW